MKNKHGLKYKQIAKAIIEYRKRENLTQRELSEKLGVSLSYISKIEAPKSEKSFSLELLFDIAEILNISVRDLLKYVE